MNNSKTKSIYFIEKDYSPKFGDVIIKSWFLNNLFHNDYGPARIIYDLNGTKLLSEWFYYGKLHRNNNKPAVIYYNKDRSIRCFKWYYNNNIHRSVKPAVIEYYKNGVIYHICWWHNNMQSPATIYHPIEVYNPNEQNDHRFIIWSKTDDDLNKQINDWINIDNIELDKNLGIKNKEDKIFFKLRWL